MTTLTDIRIQDNATGRIPRSHVLLRVKQLLRRLPARPLAVRVHFADDNGPKGGPDIRCRMLVSVPGAPSVSAESLATTARLAFDRVYERVRRQTEHPCRQWRASQRYPKKYYAAKRLWT
jgi:hypothetical protein